MRNPLAAWRAGVRWPGILLAVLTALVVAVLVCEAIGWPFLVAPAQKWMATALDRRVEFQDEEGGKSGVRLRLLGGIKVTAKRIEIGAPSWSREPHMLLARDAELRLPYFGLWKAWRGRPLHVDGLEAGELEGVLERRADGSASWQFGKRVEPDPESKPVAIPTFGFLRVRAGHVLYRDELLPALVDTWFALDDAGDRAPSRLAAASGPASAASDAGIFVRAGKPALSASAAAASVALAPGESGLKLAATGQYRKLPLRVDLRTAGVLGFLAEGAQAEAQPLRLVASVGKADLSFEGSTTDPLHFAALKGRFTLSGASLAAAGDPLGITLPTTHAFKSRGTIAKDGGVWNAVFEDATIGSSRLNGAFTYDSRRKVPLLSGRLGGSRLVLADLGPAVGAPSGGEAPVTKPAVAGERVIPDRKFDLPSLRAMDANVLINIAMFDPGTTLIEPLRPVRGHLLLADGVLTIADFEGRTAQGRLVGFLQLDGRNDRALWTADMRALGIDLAHWLRLERKATDTPPYISGKLDAMVKVKGSGRSTAEILGSLGGDLRMHVRDGTISHLVVEAGGLDIAQALGLVFRGDKSLPIQCNVMDLDVANGVATPKVFVMNTPDSTIWIDGTVSFKSEALDLRAVVSPKDFSPLTLRTPILVKGTLGDPAVSVEASRVVARTAAAGLLAALVNPLAAIVPFIDPGAREAAKEATEQCARLVPTSGKIAATNRQPAKMPVPAAPLPRASEPVAVVR